MQRKDKHPSSVKLSSESQIILNASEKGQFLTALKENGLNIIYDLDRLSEYLPNRSHVELKFVIEAYSRKGRAKQMQDDFKISMSNIKNVEEWCKVIHSSMPANSKRDDLSSCLSDIVARLGQQAVESKVQVDENEETEKIDFQAIYTFLANLLANRYPRELPEQESLVVNSLLESLFDMIGNLEASSEEHILQAGAWYRPWGNHGDRMNSGTSTESPTQSSSHSIPSTSNTQTSEVQEFSRRIEPSTSLLDATSSAGDSSHNDPNLLQNYHELPRIRKLRECLNPLRIPIDVLLKEHQTMSIFFE